MSSLALPRAEVGKAVTTPIFHLGYRPWLDGLRGIAIIAVMASHFEPHYLGRGYVGVDLFFMLSGFLITTLLLEERKSTGTINFGRFYIRRALRLFPALAAVLASATLLMLLWPSVGQNYRSVLYSAFYVMNWVMALGLDNVSSTLYFTWSLSVEEQFYIVWPALLYLLLRLRVRASVIALMLLSTALIVCAHRTSLILAGATGFRVSLASDVRTDSLLIGCGIGVMAVSGLLPRSARLVALFTGVLSLGFLCYVVGWFGNYGSGLTITAFFFGGLLTLLLISPCNFLSRGLEASPLVWIGRLSYSLYLWHLYASFLVVEGGIDRRFQVVAALALSFIFAGTSYYLIEQPFLRLKRRFASVS